jgi:hypothetical protein
MSPRWGFMGMALFFSIKKSPLWGFRGIALSILLTFLPLVILAIALSILLVYRPTGLNFDCVVLFY